MYYKRILLLSPIKNDDLVIDLSSMSTHHATDLNLLLDKPLPSIL